MAIILGIDNHILQQTQVQEIKGIYQSIHPQPEEHKILKLQKSSNLTFASRGLMAEASIQIQHHIKTRASSLLTLSTFASVQVLP